MTERNNPNQYNSIATYLPIIISTLVIVLSVIAGFWSLADPRGELTVIRSSYETLREHQEFVHRIDEELKHIQNDLQKLDKEKADVADFSFFRMAIREQLKKVQEDLVARPEFTVMSKSKDDQIARLQKELDDLSARLTLLDVKVSPPVGQPQQTIIQQPPTATTPRSRSDK